MRSLRLAMMAAGLLVAGSRGVALADQPGPDWMTREQVTQKLNAAGYTMVAGLEADDGHWEGEAVHDGRIVEFHADPKTGAILSEKPK